MAPSLMRGIQLKLVFVVVTYTVMCYIQLVAGQGSSLSYLDPSITLDTALFTMDFETSSVDLLEPSSTSSAPTTSSVDATPVPDSVPTFSPLNFSSQNMGCFCDLCIESCDTSCCCDTDCSSFEIATFSYCANSQQSSNTQICISADAIFRSSQPSSSTSSSSFSQLFCVLTDNNPGRLQFTQPQYITTTEQFSEQLTLHATPGDIPPSPPSSLTPPHTIYRTGDPIQVEYSSSFKGFFSLPSPLNSKQCHGGNPITYLVDMNSVCEQRWSTLQDVCTSSSVLNSQNYYTGFSILSLPSSTQSSTNSSNILVTLGTYQCRSASGEVMSCDSPLPPTPEYNATSGLCNHILLEVLYTVRHNGSQGIISVTADILIGQVTNDVTSLSQRFSVQFIRGSDASATIKRSGNPGYVDGLPVLAGVQESGMVNLSSDISRWMTVMAGGGACQVGGPRENVRFGDDIRTACILSVNMSDIADDCTSLRQQTLEILWSGSLVDRVGIYGNSDPTNSSQWVPLLAMPSSETGCQSVVTRVQLLLLYSKTGNLSSPQSTITGAELRYLTQNLQQSLCSGVSCAAVSSSFITITLETIVSFVPTYLPPSQVLRSTSTNSRTLPQDFLYPFFIPSSALKLDCCCLPTIITVIILQLLLLL